MPAVIPEQLLFVPKLVKGFMVGSIVVLAALLPVLPASMGEELMARLAGDGADSSFTLALVFSAVLMIAAGWFVPRPTAARLEAIVKRSRNIDDPHVAGQRVLNQALTLFIMRLSCFESVALFGLLITVGTGEPAWWVCLAAVSLLNMLLTRFPLAELQRAIERVA